MIRCGALLLCFLLVCSFLSAQTTYKICFGEEGNEYCVDYPAGTNATISVPAANNECYHFDQWMDGNTDNPRIVQVTADATYTATYSKNRLQVVTDVSPAGSGSVTGAGQYFCGDDVTLSASPAQHYHFHHWEKAGVSVSEDAVYIFQAAGNHNDIITYTAFFEIDSVKVNVVSADNTKGYATQEHPVYNAAQNNPQYYPWGVEGIVLTAVPTDACYKFNKWSDGSRQNPYTLPKVVTDSITLTAGFVPRVDTLTVLYDSVDPLNTFSVSNSPEANLIVSDATHSVITKECGGDVTMEVSMKDCFNFIGWDINNDGVADATSLGFTYTLTGNATIRLLTERKKFHVILQPDNPSHGTAFTTGGVTDTLVECGDYITLFNTPDACYEYDYWQYGSLQDKMRPSGQVGPVTQDTVFTCHFKEKLFHITFGPDDAACGSVSGEYLGSNYTSAFLDMPCGSIFELTPVAAEGCVFLGWSDGSADSVRTVVLDENTPHQFTALFSSLYVVTFESDPAGAAVGNTDKTKYVDGESATVTFTADPCYDFISWEDGTTALSKTFVVHSDTTVRALFSVRQYTVTVVSSDPAKGSVTGGGTFNCGTEVTCNATAIDGYRFKCWQENNSTDNPFTFTITSDTTLTALFEEDLYTLVVNVDGGTAIVTGAGVYANGTDVNVSVIPDDNCFEVSAWSDGAPASASRTVHLTSDSVLTASLTRHNYKCHIVFVPQQAHEDMYIDMPCGQSATINPPDVYGWHFLQWGDATTVAQVIPVAGDDTSFTAFYERNRYVIQVDCDAERGTVTGGGTYNYEDIAHLTATPADGYQFVQWSDGTTSSVYDLRVESDSSLTAVFRVVPFTVYVVQDDVMCEGEDYTLPSGRVVQYSGNVAAYVDTTDFEYEPDVWCKRIFTITLHPSAEVLSPVISVLPKAHTGKPLDAQTATEQTLAQWHTDNPSLAYSESYWEFYDTGSKTFNRYFGTVVPELDSLTLRFVIHTNCALSVSQPVTVLVSHGRLDVDGSCFSVVYVDVEEDGSLLMVDTTRMYHLGYVFSDSDVDWYQVVGGVDSETQDADTDKLVASGSALSLCRLALPSAAYYARINLPPQPELAVCSSTLFSRSVRYDATAYEDFVIAPAIISKKETVTLLGLHADENAQILVFDASGHTYFETQVSNTTFYDYAPALPAGIYFLRVITEERKKTLKFIVK